VLAPLSYYSMYGHVYALAQKARAAAAQRAGAARCANCAPAFGAVC
jgi:hypothetical protein